MLGGTAEKSGKSSQYLLKTDRARLRFYKYLITRVIAVNPIPNIHWID